MNEMIDDYTRLFVDDVPLLDIRAPVEFAKGAFPCSVNRPLLNDDEREAVGKAYKADGNQGALDHGHDLITGAIKADRVSAWHAFADMNPQGCLYCFRGGQRSLIAQKWLYEDGVEYPRVTGGYKAMRQFLLDSLAELGSRLDFILLGGRTGVGKTEVLLERPAQVDLEGLANHRGSGFGRRLTPQPTQINFENALAIELLKHDHRGNHRLLMEDEGRCIGARGVPDVLWKRCQQSPVVVLEDTIESRVRRTRMEYVEKQCQEFTQDDPEQGFERYADHLRDSLDRIARRLGGDRHKTLKAVMDQALTVQQQTGSCSNHDEWIERLLVDYYDPMYDFQIQNKSDRIQFTGTRSGVLDFLDQQT